MEFIWHTAKYIKAKFGGVLFLNNSVLGNYNVFRDMKLFNVSGSFL